MMSVRPSTPHANRTFEIVENDEKRSRDDATHTRTHQYKLYIAEFIRVSIWKPSRGRNNRIFTQSSRSYRVRVCVKTLITYKSALPLDALKTICGCNV